MTSITMMRRKTARKNHYFKLDSFTSGSFPVTRGVQNQWSQHSVFLCGLATTHFIPFIAYYTCRSVTDRLFGMTEDQTFNDI